MKIRFDTQRYASPEVVLRTSADNWQQDIIGTYVNGGWEYQLIGQQYQRGFEFKFYIPSMQGWSDGPNFASPGAGPDISLNESQVKFRFWITLYPNDYGIEDCRLSVRTSRTGWDTDLPPDSQEARAPVIWALEWGDFRDGFAFKFVLWPKSADGPIWMLGYDRGITPIPGVYYNYGCGRGGITGGGGKDVQFPFFIRLLNSTPDPPGITLRSNHTNWTDLPGCFDGSAWTFTLPWDDYFDSSEYGPSRLIFKFVRDGEYQAGPNLVLGTAAPDFGGERIHVGRVYDYTDAQVIFM